MIKVDAHAPSSILGMDKQHVDLTQAQQSLQNLFDKNVQGSEWLGWLDILQLDSNIDELASIERKAAQLQSISDFVRCIGIGGSYLGAAATMTASLRYEAKQHAPEVRFVGTHRGASELKDLMT